MNKSDDYYREHSLRAIEAAIAEWKDKSTPKELRFWIRRSYPFASPRKGRCYKIWNKVLLEKEAELGYAPKKHKQKEIESSIDELKVLLRPVERGVGLAINRY